MALHRGTAALALLACLVLGALGVAEQAKPEDPATQDEQVVRSKATQRLAASSVNFRKELNLGQRAEDVLAEAERLLHEGGPATTGLPGGRVRG